MKRLLATIALITLFNGCYTEMAVVEDRETQRIMIQPHWESYWYHRWNHEQIIMVIPQYPRHHTVIAVPKGYAQPPKKTEPERQPRRESGTRR